MCLVRIAKFTNRILYRKISLIKSFVALYIKGFPHYNLPFFLTRIIAVSIK